ncbi:MAG: hypothetical protein ABL927_03985 [Bdellovibrionales bacterium]
MNSMSALIKYYQTGEVEKLDQFVYSENRGQNLARLSGWYKFCTRNGLDEPALSRFIATIGEITNNCFDHNLGHWQDLPGCAVSWFSENGEITFGIADRGRGIVSSLRAAIGEELANSEILKLAFEKVISGRSPEKRGNGLKFVRAQILSSPKNSLICFSNGSLYKLGQPVALNILNQNFGTLIIIKWSLK